MAQTYNLERISDLEIIFKTAILNRTSTALFNQVRTDLEAGDFLLQLMGTTLLETASKCGNFFAENRLKTRVHSMKPRGLVKLMDVFKQSKSEDDYQVAPIDLVKRFPIKDDNSEVNKSSDDQPKKKRTTKQKNEAPAQTSDSSNDVHSLKRKIPSKSACASTDVTQDKKKSMCSSCPPALSPNQGLCKKEKLRPNKPVLFCDLCQRHFKTSQNLTRHQSTIHSVERNFSCSYCDKTFKTKCGRNDHMQVHQNSNDRMVCHKCGETFTFKKGLKRHLQTQHEGSQLNCGFCAYKSKRKDNLDRHLKEVHNITNFNERCMRSV